VGESEEEPSRRKKRRRRRGREEDGPPGTGYSPFKNSRFYRIDFCSYFGLILDFLAFYFWHVSRIICFHLLRKKTVSLFFLLFHMQKRMFFFIASNALALSGVLYLSKIFQTVVFSKKIFQTVFLSIVFLGYGDNMLEFFSKLIWFVLKT